jgi:dTMP kinase
VGRLIALEGLDGAGKRTLTAKLVATVQAHGASVATSAFPRYGKSPEADLAAESLRGQHGDLVGSVYAMAVLFALDRARAREELVELLAVHDIVLLDRYVASNAAYGAARLRQPADGDFVAWVRHLEFGRLALPVPHRHLLLAVPDDVARQRAAQRANEDPERGRDAFERDNELQRRTGAVYRGLAEKSWVSPWTVLDGREDIHEVAEVVLR